MVWADSPFDNSMPSCDGWLGLKKLSVKNKNKQKKKNTTLLYTEMSSNTNWK